MKPTRKVTNMLYAMMDDGTIDARAVADACLLWMSEDDVAKMAHDNELLLSQDVDADDELDEQLASDELAELFEEFKKENGVEYNNAYIAEIYTRADLEVAIEVNRLETIRDCIDEFIE